MITFDSVTKKYPAGNLALDSVSFQVEQNEFLFIVGPSGAGKTTILKLLMRSIVPTTGTIIVNGENISDPNYNHTQKLRLSIGMIFQDFKILHDRNIFENIALALKISDLSTYKIKREVNEVLELVGLLDKKYMFPIQLSAGELQRVVIARAVIGDRQIILADEPTGNLDPKTTWEIMKIFKKLEGKKTILIATHNVDVVNSYSKRVITMENGKIKKDKQGGKYEL